MPTWGYILIGVGLALVLCLAFILVILKTKKKKSKIKIDDVFINELVSNYGGIENIVSTNVDNGRLKIEVKNLELAKLENLKNMSTGGIFVTGNVIKTLYRLDSKTIKDEIDNLR